MSCTLIKWSHFEYAYIECILHMHGSGTCQIYQLHRWCTCSARLQFHRCWSYCVCVHICTYCVRIDSWTAHTAESLCMRCIRRIFIFLYKISSVKAMRHSVKSERISQTPVRKMAGMSIITTGSVSPLTIYTHYYPTTGRSWDIYIYANIHCRQFPLIDYL